MNKIYLSRRNLLTLLNKLDRAAKGEETARTVWKRDERHLRFPSTPTEVVAIEDADYYTDRNPGPTHEIETLMTQIPWLQAIDECLIVNHVGVMNPTDSFERAQKKLAELICLEIQMACDPAINGGMTLVPVALVTAIKELDKLGYLNVETQYHRAAKEAMSKIPTKLPYEREREEEEISGDPLPPLMTKEERQKAFDGEKSVNIDHHSV